MAAMSPVAQTMLVAEREISETVRSKSFRNGTIFTVVAIALVIVGFSVLPALFGGDDALPVGVLPDAEPIAGVIPHEMADMSIELTSFGDRADAERALEEGDVHAVLAGGETVLVDEGLGFELTSVLQNAVSTMQMADDLGATPEEVIASSSVGLDVEILNPVDEQLAQRRGRVLFGILAAMGQVMGGAFMVAYGVVEEKSSRVVEVVLAKTSPRLLLAGKLIGLGVVNLLQLAILVAVGLIGAQLSPDLDIPSGLLGASGLILIWFLLAYAIFAALFSIAGALTARQEDMQQKVQPAMYLLMVVFGAAFFAFGNGDSPYTTILSFLPFTAPAVMPVRDAVVGVPFWEQSLAMLATLAGAAAAVWIAGAVYAGGALRMRGKVTFRQALRSADS